ncbi:hypothetical protein Ciccas_008486, partial [Cichlidogyrus casuarinus]
MSDNITYSDNAFLASFERTTGIANESLAITVLVLIFLGVLLILIFIITICCICKKLRTTSKIRRRPKMRGLYKDEVPGAEGNIKAVVGSFEYALEYDAKKSNLK